MSDKTCPFVGCADTFKRFGQVVQIASSLLSHVGGDNGDAQVTSRALVAVGERLLEFSACVLVLRHCPVACDGAETVKAEADAVEKVLRIGGKLHRGKGAGKR